MEGNHVLFSDLKAGRGIQHVVARLLRFWEARNVKKGGELMGVDMLLLDEKSTLLQGSISATRLNQFKDRLHEGTIFTIGGFDVTRSNPNFRLCDSTIVIRFSDSTTLAVVPETLCSIPTEKFRFRTYEEILALANSNSDLPDIVGEILSVRATTDEHTQLTKRIMTQIRLPSGPSVCLSAFDALAVALDQRLQATGTDRRVILATNINPKSVGGKLYLNATSGTHFYFDEEMDATRNFTKEMKSKNEGGSTTLSIFRGVQKLETVTISELNDYILKSAPKATDFLCTAQVTGIQGEKGWRYISCSKCSKKLSKGTSAFFCAVCHNQNAIGVVRYRVVLSVSDNTDNASFVAFDTDMTKLTKVRATDGGPIADDTAEDVIPDFLSAIVGKTYKFQVKVTDFNFTAKHQSFTISRIFEAPDLTPEPLFTTEGEDVQTQPPNPKVEASTALDVPPAVPHPAVCYGSASTRENKRRKNINQVK